MPEMDPLSTATHIRDTYLRYLKTTFPLQDPALADAYDETLTDSLSQLVKGPLLEASPPYVLGSSIAELADQGVLRADFSALCSEALPLTRPLYAHQERAVRHI